MKNVIYLIAIMITMASCFGNSRTRDDEELRRKREKEAFVADSIKKRRAIPDTTLVRFKRLMLCDGRNMMVFDRVELLSGDEAQEYAERHKRFGNTDEVVVNVKEVLETLPVHNDAQIYLYRPVQGDGDSVPRIDLKKCYMPDLYDLEFDQVLQLVVQNRNILYLKEMQYE